MRCDRIEMEYVRCDLCGASHHTLLYRVRSAYKSVTFSICKCDVCGLIFTNPRLCDSELKEVYSEAYYSGTGTDPHFRGETPEKVQDADLLVRSAEALLPGRRLKILDIGGGFGLVSLAAQRRGHEVVFVDVSTPAVERAVAAGLKAFSGTLEVLLGQLGHDFDVVIALEVIEHVYSPTAFLNAINSVLRAGGCFIFTTGNVGETRWKGRRWGYFSIPEAHVYFFSESTISAYLRNAGFSGRVSPYKYFFKRWWGVRVLEAVGFVRLADSVHANTWVQRVSMLVFECADKLAGRHRFYWAIK